MARQEPPEDVEAKAAALNIQGYELPPEEPEVFEVRADCRDAVQMFVRVVSQPREGPIGTVNLEWLFRLYEVKNPRQMLDDLRVMESAWLQAMEEAA